MNPAAVRDILISVLSFSLMTLGVKALQRIPSHEVVFFRALVSLSLCYFALRKAGIPALGKNRPVLLLRGTAGTVALLMYFYTLQNMPLASAVTLQYLSPIFTVFVCWLWLKEKVTLAQAGCFMISFAGAALIKGFDARISVLLLLLGVASAMLSGVAYTAVRKLKDEHALVVVLYFPLVTVPLVGAYTAFHWVTPNLQEIALLIYVGVTTQIAQVHMTRAYQGAPAAKIMIFNYLGAVFAMGFGYIIFAETLPVGSLAGIALVLVGLVISTRIKMVPRADTRGT